MRMPCPPPKRTSLSPPRPTASTFTASTIGRQSPIKAPSPASAGWPSRTTAMSVVVPPMSATMARRRPLRAQAPITLAAGPESTVVTGCCSALAALTTLPSPRTTISGASMPRAASVACTDSISVWT